MNPLLIMDLSFLAMTWLGKRRRSVGGRGSKGPLSQLVSNGVHFVPNCTTTALEAKMVKYVASFDNGLLLGFGRLTSEERRGRGGRDSGIQKFVYQKWPSTTLLVLGFLTMMTI